MLMQRSLLGLAAVGLWATALSGWGQEPGAAAVVNPGVVSRRQQVDAAADQALNELFALRPDVKALYDQAAGYAAFTATKAGGFFVTGGGGTGVAVNKNSAQRTYMRMGMGGVGFGLGAQRYSMIILFQDDMHLNHFIAGGWDASANAQAAAGQEGITLTSSFVDGVAFYQITDKGLMAQADVSGTRFWAAEDLN
jgi:lipid-binding SYLF domain-containing protein